MREVEKEAQALNVPIMFEVLIWESMARFKTSKYIIPAEHLFICSL